MASVEQSFIVPSQRIRTNKGDLNIFESDDDLAKSMADHIAAVSESSLKARGVCSVVLSGDYLVPLLKPLTEPPYADKIDWGKWHVFWVDERVVPLNSSDSNYNYANKIFLSKVPIKREHIYPISDAHSAEKAAENYEATLQNLVNSGILAKTENFPVFDIMLLGMGPDGHVASLFPNHPQVHETKKWVTYINDSPKPPPKRITFSMPVINSAKDVSMVLCKPDKAASLSKVFAPPEGAEPLPVQLINPVNGQLVWFADKAAASQIPIKN
eukprot:TRINITY_DN11344_c0_g1_i2.p1 TRINITY_DN11344_c0_g1~~TRINITY_DN11344_c0_g1_i2.p1  ORF type:complete len:314 (-),score=48.98 TRINITY_DN11344_c0_g1_i2:54-863(-)